MRLYFKERAFSWLDSYAICDKLGNLVYNVKGQLAQGHCLKFYDAAGNEVATIQEQIVDKATNFLMYKGNQYVGLVKKEQSFLSPTYTIEYGNWQVKGNFAKLDYMIVDDAFGYVGSVSRTKLEFASHVVVDSDDSHDSMVVLMIAISIYAELGSREEVFKGAF